MPDPTVFLASASPHTHTLSSLTRSLLGLAAEPGWPEGAVLPSGCSLPGSGQAGETAGHINQSSALIEYWKERVDLLFLK